MKKLLFFASILCLVSCENKEKFKLIETHVCTTDGVLSNLKFKGIDLKETVPITVVDSIVFLVYGYMPEKQEKLTDSINGTIDTLLNDNIEYKELLLKQIEEINGSIQKLEIDGVLEDIVIKYKEMIDQREIELEKTEITIKKLELAKAYCKMPSETVLVRPFDCTYSIFNPLLQVKQTLTQRFYFDNNLTKVIGSYNVKN